MNFNRACSTMTVQLIAYIQNNPNTVYHMDRFLARYQNAIFNFIRLTTGDYHDSLELTNRVLLTLSRKVKEIKVKKAFNRMVLKVIKGELSNYWKSRKTHKARLAKSATIWHNDRELCLFDTLEGDEPQAEEILNLLVIRDLIENSPDPNYKQIFLMKYQQEASIEQISRTLGITEYQVKKYLAEIHLKVKSYLEEG